MRFEFRYLDPPSNPDADFWISFFRKIPYQRSSDLLTLVLRFDIGFQTASIFWPVLPLGVHRTPAAGELSPAELW